MRASRGHDPSPGVWSNSAGNEKGTDATLMGAGCRQRVDNDVDESRSDHLDMNLSGIYEE